MLHGVVLLPRPDQWRDLVGYSRQLAAASPVEPVLSLGDDRPPHLTLAHARCARETAERWWAEVAEAVPPRLAVKLSGLMFVPMAPGNEYEPEGGVYYGVEAVRHERLDAAHRTVLGVARRVGADPIGAVDDAYRPHVTLGVVRSLPVTVSALPPDLVTGVFDGGLALGRIRPNGSVAEVLYRK